MMSDLETQALTLCDEYWQHYIDTEPLDASTLGAQEACHRLPNLSHEAWIARAEYARQTLARIQTLPLEHLRRPEIKKDIEAIRRLALYTVHQVERKFELVNIAWSDMPPTMLILQAGEAQDTADWEALATRLETYPKMLEQHEDNLRAGRTQGLAPDYEETRFVAEHKIPEEAMPLLSIELANRIQEACLPDALATRLLSATAQATMSLESHADFLKRFTTDLPREWRPDGEEEAAWRLRELHGISEAPRGIFDQSAEWIRQEQARFVETAQAIDPAIRDFRQALTLLDRELQRAYTPTTPDAALALYRKTEARMESEARRAGIPLPKDYEVRIEKAPLGYGYVASISNLPPPF